MLYKIGLYIRVSTEEQAMRTEGSLESQKYRLNGFVDIKNMQQPNWGSVVETYLDEGLSAKDTRRPALQKMLKDLQKGQINMVLVTDISRLSRSIRDFCVLIDVFKDTKTQFLSLKEQFDTTTAAGEMMLFNMINLAQFERRQISERVSLNFHSRAIRGLRNGGATALGFDVDVTNKSTFKINESEAITVRQIFDLYLQEGSLYKTASQLRERGIAFKGNNSFNWNVQTLKNLLRNHSYIGMREVNKCNKTKNQNELGSHEKYQVVKASWPAIIDEATFFTVQKMLNENSSSERNRLSNSSSRVYLVSGIATCGECGRALVGSAAHGRIKAVRYYAHRPIEGKPSTCSMKRIRADRVEEVIVNHLLHVVQREGYLEGIENSIAKNLSGERDYLIDQKSETKKSILEIDTDIRKIIKLQIQTDDLELHKIYSEQLIEMKDKRNKLSDILDSASSKLEGTPSPEDYKNAVELNLKKLHLAWNKSAPRLQKALIRSVIDRLIFKPDCIDIYYRPINEKNFNDKNTNSTGQNLVELSKVREMSKNRHKNSMLHGLSEDYNEKFEMSYVGKIGCPCEIKP